MEMEERTNGDGERANDASFCGESANGVGRVLTEMESMLTTQDFVGRVPTEWGGC